jgi:ectoine hydroxylase-related dioxygenase (phytanoyl-CoA dioxygenase family)
MTQTHERAASDITYEPTEADVAEYRERGYWISPKLIDDDHIARLRDALDRLFKGEIDGVGGYFDPKLNNFEGALAMRRVVNAWWVNDEVRDLVLDPGMGRICARLMGVEGARLWSDQVLSKPGGGKQNVTVEGNVGWHQDHSYWRISSTTNMITAWVALQDTDLSNGGMRTIVGSNKWGEVEGSDGFYDKDLDSLRARFESKAKTAWLDEPCILKAGQASFHHALTFHASETNRTDAPRMSVVGHYMPDGTTFKPCGKQQTHLRLLGPRPKAGQRFDGPVFPLVYPTREAGF